MFANVFLSAILSLGSATGTGSSPPVPVTHRLEVVDGWHGCVIPDDSNYRFQCRTTRNTLMRSDCATELRVTNVSGSKRCFKLRIVLADGTVRNSSGVVEAGRSVSMIFDTTRIISVKVTEDRRVK